MAFGAPSVAMIFMLGCLPSGLEYPEPRNKTMSVERIQLLHEDYIRLTERFKALVDVPPVPARSPEDVLRVRAELRPGLRQALRRRAGRRRRDRHDLSREGRAPDPRARRPPRRVLGRKLREADRHISPSYVRRFFEKVQPQDEKIAFHLLRFYFSQPDVDEDVVDKVDFLATVVAAGQSRHGVAAPRGRGPTSRSSSSPRPRRRSGRGWTRRPRRRSCAPSTSSRPT